ncbi:MAG: tyrosine-type recombinase/integrase [bacterium]
MQSNWALKRARIENFRFHDLHHTLASKLVMAGVDIRAVQELMGHKSIKMTMKYSHLSDVHLREAVKRLEVGTDLAQEPLRKTGGARKALRNNGRYAT